MASKGGTIEVEVNCGPMLSEIGRTLEVIDEAIDLIPEFYVEVRKNLREAGKKLAEATAIQLNTREK